MIDSIPSPLKAEEICVAIIKQEVAPTKSAVKRAKVGSLEAMRLPVQLTIDQMSAAVT